MLVAEPTSGTYVCTLKLLTIPLASGLIATLGVPGLLMMLGSVIPVLGSGTKSSNGSST